LWVQLWVGVAGTIPSNPLKEMAGTTGLEPAASAVTAARLLVSQANESDFHDSRFSFL
jgi:hypothetical protein